MSLEAYEFKDTIAQSARTVVRRASSKCDGTAVVVKALTRDYPGAHELGQLEFEYRILRKMNTPGVVRALALEKDGDRLAIILEDFGGENIPSHTPGKFPLDLFFTIATTITSALGHIHGHGVIHKDVKPRNILMNPRTGAVKLIDFNIASELSLERQDIGLSDQLEGSLPYISPEQTGRMNRDLDYRTDYYSLGITFFELLTGALPFSATDMMGWVHCHISKPAPSPRILSQAIPEVVAKIVCKLMAKNPDERYQSAHGLLKDLENCQRQWTAQRAIAEFPLGQHDVSERFQVSQKLFGRERDARALLEIFEAASRGPAKILLVSGYSGVGKSSFIQEIQTSIVNLRGNFIAGKFDEIERNAPYGALVQALRGLVKQLLAQPEDRLQLWRQRLCAGVGANGQVLVDLIPEIEQVIGRQQPVPELGAHEAHGRFQRTFRGLIKAVGQPEQPLVIFLDDLQWADASTPDLLVQLFGDEELRHVLLIGAYRDNEVKEGHLLLSALKELERRRPEAVRQIVLQPLSEASVNSLIAETLRRDPARTEELAALILQKTGGNPFFVNELLSMLHRDGAFRFVVEEGGWDWDKDKIAGVAVSDNVVHLMVQRLRRLPPRTLEILPVAACIGNQFDLQTLARILEQPAGGIAAALWDAVQERVLDPLGGNYRLVRGDHVYDDEKGPSSLAVHYQFQHDRVRQAAYSLLGEEERARLHLKIGRLLLLGSGAAEREEKLFELVNHLNLGRRFLETEGERAQLAELNYVSGLRAKRSAAYAIAATYLETSLDLLSAEEWSARPARRFECSRARIECVFLAGGVERATELCDELLPLAHDKVTKGATHYLKAGILEHDGRLLDAVDTIRRGLRLLDVELPDDHAEIDREIGAGIGRMQAHLGRTRIEDFVKLPSMTDEAKIMTMNLLFQLVPPAIQTYPPLFVLAELMMFDLALTHGTTVASCKNFVDCGIIQGGILGDYSGAYRLGKVAFALLERYAPTPLEAAVHFVFGAFVSHWKAHYDEGFDAFAMAKRAGLEMGDIQHTAYAVVHRIHRMILVGRDLDECHEQTESTIVYLTQARAVGQLTGATFAERAIAQLRGPVADSAILQQSSDAFDEEMLKAGNAQWLYSHGQTQLMVSFLLGDVEAAERWCEFTAPYLPAAAGLFSLPDYYLFRSLVLVRKCKKRPEAERASILEELLDNQDKLRKWAECCPDNFAHKYKLVSAEIAHLRGAPIEEIIVLYDEAISSAGEGFLHLRALANELEARFWLEQRQRKIAKTFLKDAYYLYRRWGAHAKLKQLAWKYPEWLGVVAAGELPQETQTIFRDTAKGASLDLTSVIKATQAISSEVKPDRLFAKLMSAIIENAGAQRGCLILKSDSGGGLFVEARAHVEGDTREESRSMPIKESTELCPEIVRYVARTSDTIVIDDATRHAAYLDDPYIRKNSVRSVLCLPVLNQGKLVAILYAENNAVTHAFTPGRLSLLQVIASQAAISITNARLYGHLEEKVTERTRELAEKNREVAAMLNSMQQGIFTIDQRLVIQPRYSEHLEQILGTREIAGGDCLEMLFQGSNIGQDALTAMRGALQASFGVPIFLAEANARHLVKEFHRTNQGETKHFEVDWNLIVGEGGDVDKILVALRDVTLVKQLNDKVAEKARELDIVGQILDAGLEAFQRFCGSTRGFLRDITAVLGADAPLTGETLELLFRNMHTVKGNARMLGLGHLVDAVHSAEDAYGELRRNPEIRPDRQRLAAGVDAVLSIIENYEEVCQRKLGDLSRGHGARIELALNEIQGAVTEAADGVATPSQALRSVDRALSRANAVPLRELIKDCARMLPSLARELGKSPPIVDYSDVDAMLTPAWAQALRDILVHVFRNSLDHGIETSEERQAKGKSNPGRIALRVERAGDRATLRLSDDGAGLRLEALREQTGKLPGSDEEIAQRAFLSGVSTALRISSVSGRGVGLDAVRSFVRNHGGEVRIAFTAEGRDGCRPFELVLDLPEGAMLAEPREVKELSRSIAPPPQAESRVSDSIAPLG